MADELNNGQSVQGTEGHESETVTVEGMKASLQKVNNNQQKCVAMNSIPTDSTLTFSVTDPVTGQPVTKYFKIGDRVVVEDQEHGDEEYDYLVVYTLLKLYKEGNVDKALWAPGGAGGGGGATGKIRVNLEAYVNGSKTAGADLTGLEVTVTNTTDGTTVATKQWAGETLVFTRIVPLKAYSISVQQKAGYATPAAQTISEMGIGDDVTKTFQYEADEYTVQIASNQGTDAAIANAKVTYNNVQYGNGDTFKVAKGTSVSPTTSDMTAITDYTPSISVSGKTISALYSTTLVSLVVTSSLGTDADIDSLQFTIDGKTTTSGVAVKVATGKQNVAVVLPDVTGYQKPSVPAFTATGTSQALTAVQYQTNVYTVRFTSNQDVEGTPDADLDRSSSGVQGYVRYQYGGETITGGKVFHDGDTIKIPADAATANIELYNISNKTSDGYSSAVVYDHTNHILTGAYSTTKVFLTAASNQGSSVVSGLTFKINGTNITQNDDASFVKVPTGDSITVTAPDVTHYAKVVTGGGTASGTTQTVNVSYNATKVGVNMVSSNNGVEGAFPTGAEAYVKYTDDSGSEQTQTLTANMASDATAFALVPVGKSFTVDYKTITNYSQPAQYSGTAAGASMTADKAIYIYGVLEVAVTMSDNDTTDLASVRAYITVGSAEEVEMSGSVSGTTKTFSLSMDSGTSYTVRFGGVAGYATPASISDTKGAGVDTKTAEYLTTLVSLSMTGRSDGVQGSAPSGAGGTVKYTGGTDQHITSGTAKVPRGTAFVIDYDAVSGWSTPAQFSQAAGYSSATITATSAEYSQGHLTISLAQTGGSDGDLSNGGFTLSIGGSTASYSAGMAVPTGAAVVIDFTAIEGYATPAQQSFTMNSEAKSVTGTYQTTPVTVTMTSNQSSDSVIGALKATVSYTYGGSTVTKDNLASGTSVKVPTGVTPTITFPDATGYRKTVSGSAAQYDTEILTISITKDSGSGDLSSCSIAVTNGQTSLGTLTNASPTLKIPYGVNYTLTPSSLEGYNAPAAVTKDWSDTATKSLTFQYEEVTLITGYIILDQTSSDPTTKVLDESGHTYNNYQRPAVIDAIRAASHCYVGTFANNKMTLKQLDDTDGTKYADGTSAASDIASTSKDVFMRLPFFFTRVSTYATDKIKIEFAFDPNQTVTTTAQPDGSGWKQWGGNDLIGKYEAYEESNKTYSISGKTSTGSVSPANMKSHARARGTGFTLVKWRHQNLMAILFYAYYGHTNCQSLIGSGASSNNKSTGLKNSLGMTDTTSANGNTDNIVFWGLENWWGNKYEWVDNVVVNSGTWVITEDDGTTRTPTGTMAAAGSWVYPSKFVLNDDLDVICATGQTGGSDSTGYCDGQYIANSSSRVVARSYSYADAKGGVACVCADYVSSNSYPSIGSRLAFTGTIEIS